jgi:hypothetical protein
MLYLMFDRFNRVGSTLDRRFGRYGLPSGTGEFDLIKIFNRDLTDQEVHMNKDDDNSFGFERVQV